MIKFKRDIRHLIGAGIIVLSAIAGSAETVSQKEAMKIAQTFLNELYGEVTAPPKMVWNGRQLTTNRLFVPFYVYNSPKGGFVIISAENKAYPVLAYSKTESFNKDRLGESEKQQLTRYAREIELIRYDSRIPEKAIESWQKLPQYLVNVIEAPYSTDEYRNLSEEDKEALEAMDRRNNWILMPGAVEYTVYDPDLYREITLEDVLAEEEPFSFFESFLAEARAEAAEREMILQERLEPTQPVVTPLGGGHYQVFFPENVLMMRVYNISGAKSMEKYYDTTNVANLNLESLPEGFYAGLALCESGRIYGFKFVR